MAKKTMTKAPKQVETLKHDEASRKNIPTAELRSVLEKESQDPLRVAFERRNRDLDPQLVWRGKDERDWSDLVVPAPPLFIQEKVHPKVLIDDLVRRSARSAGQAPGFQIDLFADFNGVPEGDAKTEFYQHDANWSNRMILGDSLQVMASLAEREGLRGQVQCIYLDPPYGIKVNSTFQWSTTSREVKDGNADQITREPEQVKAFRDTWRDGIHSYLTYLRDRLTVARDLLTERGSIFVQIGDENVHRVRAVMDEVFGDANFCCVFTAQKTGGLSQALVPNTSDYLLWYCKDRSQVKFRQLYLDKSRESVAGYNSVELTDGRRMSIKAAQAAGLDFQSGRYYQPTSVESANPRYTFAYQGTIFYHRWKTHSDGLRRLAAAARFHRTTNSLRYVRFIADFPAVPLTSVWTDTGSGSFLEEQIYVVQTVAKIIQRCILMATDPGDLVLDPTCGSGTTAYVAEQWGRRWITIDTSRVALALARARIMGARYPFYYLADSRAGQLRDAEVRRTTPSAAPTNGDLRQGFVYERVPHVTLKSIANNAEIDVLWEKHQASLEPLRQSLNAALGTDWEEWQIPREAVPSWPAKVKDLHTRWWQGRIARQHDIDASIARNADEEYLYDKPYDDKKTARVAGPFTVESLSPHRVMTVDENDELVDPAARAEGRNGETRDFAAMILENLRTSGVQQAHKEDRITFTSLIPWPGDHICAEGRYLEGDPETGTQKRAAIFIGPEFGTVARPDLVFAAREAGDADFDVLIACAFNYEAHASEFHKLGRIPVLKARMNADLHMAGDLKNTGKGNLFVIFGEPDIDILPAGESQIQVKINGVDVFHPNTGEVRSDGAEGIACWFIDTDYNEESFFVRHAYFLGANDPYKALKTTLKAEIDEDAWATLHSDISRPFDKPMSGRIAVKVINHLGDEVMKVFRVG
jgi:adenine-specific DNA-methyltransferase